VKVPTKSSVAACREGSSCDVREKRSLAYNTRSSSRARARPGPPHRLRRHADGQTGLAVQALLDNLKRHLFRPSIRRRAEYGPALPVRHLRRAHGDHRSVADNGGLAQGARLPTTTTTSIAKRSAPCRRTARKKASPSPARGSHRDRRFPVTPRRSARARAFRRGHRLQPRKRVERIRTIPANPAAPIELERETGQ